MTEQEMLARIAELEKQVARKAPSARIKVSPKGGVSFYGTGRWPVTLYASQWEILANALPEIQAFIKANNALLSHKPEESKAETAQPATV